MQRAKDAIGEFLHNAGHHDTTVHEKIAPAITQEVVKKTRHDEVITAREEEVHQEHYHTTYQPITAKEILPEEHQAVIAQVQERHIDHGDAAAVAARLEAERKKLQDSRVVVEGAHTQTAGPELVGREVHHHVHETIQPILQKEVIAPTVVHTTVPIHEVHHNEPVIHSASALPAVSLSEFERQGGTLAGRSERIDHFEGDPKPVTTALGGSVTKSPLSGTTGITSPHSSTTSPHSSITSPHSSTTGPHSSTTSPYSATHRGTDGNIGQAPNKTAHSSALLNKLDPRVDSDGDGRKGIGK